MKKKKWIVSAENPIVDSRMGAIPGMTRLAARVLAARHIETPEQAQAFTDKSEARIGDPFLLLDMDKAVAEIESAIANDVKIAIYGDYDVDGVTSTCILIKYLRSRGARCVYYIPDRLGEGYGLNISALQSLYDEGCRLLITVDSGITAVPEAQFAKEIGLRLIITDHHECKEELPEAIAAINPRRQGSEYPFRELAGVGVAFKLLCALNKERPLEELLAEYSDIVAVGTIADVMPLTGENRAIVSIGLEYLQNTKNPGLRALMQKLGLDTKPLTSNSVSFVMAPRINAAGRMGGAASAAQLFLTDDPLEAAELADALCDMNRQRQEEENGIYEEITVMLRSNPELAAGKTLVLWNENWHNGVIGIVASRLSDHYGIPCVLISISEGSGKGSGRSIKGFNLYSALESAAGLLLKYGGHELAVGLTIEEEKLPAFREAIERYAQKNAVSGVDAVPSVTADCGAQATELTINEVRGLQILEPFGMGNPQPTFIMRNVRVEEITPISHDRHIKMQLSIGGKSFYAFVFGMGAASCPYIKGDMADIIFAAEINSYRGHESVQLIVKDIKWAGSEEEKDSADYNMYELFMGDKSIDKNQALVLSPTRDDLVAIFRHVKINAEGNVLVSGLRTLYRKIRYESGSTMNMGKLLVCLDIFKEFSLFDYELCGDDAVITVRNYKGKADINGSKIIKKLLDIIKA